MRPVPGLRRCLEIEPRLAALRFSHTEMFELLCAIVSGFIDPLRISRERRLNSRCGALAKLILIAPRFQMDTLAANGFLHRGAGILPAAILFHSKPHLP